MKPLSPIELEAVLARSQQVAYLRERAEARALDGSRPDAFALASLTIELGNLRALIQLGIGAEK